MTDAKRRAQAKYRTVHKARIAAASKARREANIADARRTANARRAANPSLAREVSRRSYAKNAAKRYESHRAWKLANPEKAKRGYLEMRAFIVAAKSAPCMDCGGTFEPVCMDFDHRPGEVKVLAVGSLASFRNLERIKAEIAKCDLVCANCHRLRTHKTRKR